MRLVTGDEIIPIHLIEFRHVCDWFELRYPWLASPVDRNCGIDEEIDVLSHELFRFRRLSNELHNRVRGENAWQTRGSRLSQYFHRMPLR